MTPKEKAKELVLKYWNLPIKMNHIIDGVIHIETEKHLYVNDAKQCALVAVNEIIEQWEYVNTYLADLDGELNPNLIFWYEVKQEIEAL